MRLTLVLSKWPKSRPKGHIWSGKDRMIPRMLEPNRQRLMKQVEMEKSNMFYIIHPAVSFEAEDAFHRYMTSIQPSETDIKDMLERAELEATSLGPIPISDHYDVINRYNTFEKD